MLLGFPLAVVSFSLVLTGLAVGIGTSVILLGLVLLSVVLVMARGLAHVDRIRLSDLYDRPVMRLPYRTPPEGAGPLSQLLNPIACSRSWLDALHALLRLPLATASFVVAVIWWTLSLGASRKPKPPRSRIWSFSNCSWKTSSPDAPIDSTSGGSNKPASISYPACRTLTCCS